jgi:large subunit ribosomal protein L24
MKIRKGDQVLVIAGKNKGERGRVRDVILDRRDSNRNRVVIEGVNFVKRHRRPRSQTDQGGIIEFEAPIHISNVMLICSQCREPVRVGFDFLPEGGKVRICRSCGRALD